jgi:PAS domain S-box-containing protein
MWTFRHHLERIFRGTKQLVAPLLMVGAATAVRLALDPILFNHVPFITFFLAVYAASLLGGIAPGLIATALSAVAGAYFIAEPRLRIYISSLGDVLQLVLFLIVGVAMSVSNHRVRTGNARLKAALAELEHRNRVTNMALKASMSGSWELNLETGQLSWDEASDQLYGLDSGPAPSLEAFYSLIHPADVDRIHAVIDNCQTGQISDFQNGFRAIVRERIRYMESRGQVTCDTAGRPTRLIGITSDITERKLAEEERAILEAKLIELRHLESLGRLAGGVAHDFNNLLTVINGYAELLSARLNLPDPIKNLVMEISNAGRRAADLVSQLVTFGQKQKIRPRALDLNELIREAEVSLRQLLGKKSQLVLKLEPNLGHVMADPNQICQALTDIIINAREAMPDGGTVEIETANFELGHKIAGFADVDPGRYVRISMTDTRAGATEDYLSHIFEPYFTVKELRGVGAGLGLATVLGIVRQNKGWIDVRRQAGKGASFRIYLPWVAGATAQSQQESHTREGSTAKA